MYDDLMLSEEARTLQTLLSSLNVPQDKVNNLKRFAISGGIRDLIARLCLDPAFGLASSCIPSQRARFGENSFPISAPPGLLALMWEALTDSTIIILMFAATLSLTVELLFGERDGWVDGVAILAAVALVALVTSTNNYVRNQQFQTLEKAAAGIDTTTVLRDGHLYEVHPRDLVVGDVAVLNVGDCVPADCVLLSSTAMLLCDESSLTGESTEVTKRHDEDCFLLSSSLVLHGAPCHALVIAVGSNSQWGQIRANLVTSAQATPLQEKLERLAQKLSLTGIAAAAAIYLALALHILVNTTDRVNVVSELLKAFILVTTVVVAAVPEGLPLAVTLTLAHCNHQLFREQCLVRTLAACETMGNVTTICTDKTGTLTENRMTVVMGYVHDLTLNRDEMFSCPGAKSLRDVIAANVAINRTAYSVKESSAGQPQPKLVGNFTELALLRLVSAWGYDPDEMKRAWLDAERDEVLPFSSYSKQSAVIMQTPVHLRGPSQASADGGRLKLVKGAPEQLLAQCRSCHLINGDRAPLDDAGRALALSFCHDMAGRSLRIIALAHEYVDGSEEEGGLCLDMLLGIHDPLREEAYESIAEAQRAGIKVRLMTGDSLPTALSIAADCGIVPTHGHDHGRGHENDAHGRGSGAVAITGERLRELTPSELDRLLPSLSVVARCSPEDKLLLVARLSGRVPRDEVEWTQRVRGLALPFAEAPTWAADRDRILPGYRAEWQHAHPDGGEVVAVTGDGTNDAPALRAADIGLAMGQSGTKVAQAAADMVLLDDNFRSIVQAILWGRAVYDNVRKFLQFQLTANLTAVVTIFVAAAAGAELPLSAVQVLWLNIVMDPLGALALAVEPPDRSVLMARRPYRRRAPLVTGPMWCSVVWQSAGLLAVMMTLQFVDPAWLGMQRSFCVQYDVASTAAWDLRWDADTCGLTDQTVGAVACQDFSALCPGTRNAYCFSSAPHALESESAGNTKSFVFAQLDGFADRCLSCRLRDRTYQTFAFNTFMFYHIFNLWNARNLFADPAQRPARWEAQFTYLSAGMAAVQLLLVTVGGDFAQTSALSWRQLLASVALGSVSLLVGALVQRLQGREDPKLFAPPPATPDHPLATPVVAIYGLERDCKEFP